MVSMNLFSEPSQLMCDPVLDFRSLYVGKKAQYPAIGLCHGVDLVVETPVDLPLGEEQLCPLTFSVEYLRGVSHEFGPSSSCGLSRTGTGTSSWWSAASTCWWSSCTPWWSSTKSSSAS